MNIYADFSSNFQMKYTNKESPPVGQAPQFEKKTEYWTLYYFTYFVISKKNSYQPFFSMKLKDPSSQRYEVHLPGGVPQSKANTQSVLYTTEYQSDPFGFMVRRKSNGRVM